MWHQPSDSLPIDSTATTFAMPFSDAKGWPHLGNVTHEVELGLLHAQGRDDVRDIRQRKGRRQLHRPAVTPAPEPSSTETTADTYHRAVFGVE